MELSDELYARQPMQGWRGRVEGSRSGSNVLHLSVETTCGKITRTLNTSDDAKAIERAKPIVAKAVEDGRVRPHTVAALTYAPPSVGKPVCCKVQAGGNYSTKIALLDGNVGIMSLDTRNEELAKDRMRVVAAAWLAQKLILATTKAARVYGPGGLDAEFGSEASRLEAERWFHNKCNPSRQMLPAYGAAYDVSCERAEGSMGRLANPRAVMRLANRKAPPFMQWSRGPEGKPALQSHLYLRDRPRLCAGLNTSDTETAGQRMRLLVWHAINEGLLPGGFKHAAWRLYGGPIPQSIKRMLARFARLAWPEYQPHRKEATTRLGLHVKAVDWLAKQDKERPESATAIRSRRARLRGDGHRFPKRNSWHFGPVGSMLAIHRDGGPIYALLTIASSIFRWRLKARDRERAAAIMEPVRSARANVRKAAEEWAAFELGTTASVTAEPNVVTACGLFATALRAVGASDECIRLAMKPPPEVGTAVPQRTAAVTAAPNATLSMTKRRQVAEKQCEKLLIERYEVYLKDGRKERPLKDELRDELTVLIPKLTGRAFDRSWKATAVAKDWDWKDPGIRAQGKPPQKTPSKNPLKK